VSSAAALPQGWQAALKTGRPCVAEGSLPGALPAQALASVWLASTPARPFFFLDTPSGAVNERLSLLAGEPLFVLEGRGAKAWLLQDGRRQALGLPPQLAYARLARLLARLGVCEAKPGLLPLLSVLSYEAGVQYEAWKLPKAEPMGLPDWLAVLPRRWAWRKGRRPWRSRELFVGDRFHREVAKALGLKRSAGPAPKATRPRPLADTHSLAGFGRMVRKAQEDIAAGEYYQANLSHRLSAPYNGGAFELYQRLAQANPSPMGAFVDLGDTQVICNSPERLFRVKGSEVESWPIAGTAPNHGRPGERARLRRSAKDSAEHVMLVDLQRNDIGRVSVGGSVKVPKFKTVQSFRHVHHLVSQVTGQLLPGKDVADLLEAGFPGASVTGAPKMRVLQAIAQLEGTRRGWYTGSLGYWDPVHKLADFNIMIRTGFLRDGRLTWAVGSGIVADSVPKKEWEETLAKGKAFRAVLRG
jgi:anthranilate/para-aminobenzoate synthase component I